MRELVGRICAHSTPDMTDRKRDDLQKSYLGALSVIKGKQVEPGECCAAETEARCKASGENLILAAYILWMTGSVLSVTMWEKYGVISVMSDLLRRIPHFLLLFEFLQRGHYTKKDAAGVFLLVFTGIVSGHSVHSNFVMPAVLFVFFSAKVRFRTILKITLLFHAVVMSLTIAASQAGIIEDVIWYEGERIRHSLGYDYCGYPAHLLLFMTLMWLCLRRCPRVLDAAFLLPANYLMYYLTDSRTDFYLGVLAIAGAFVWTADFRFRPACVLRRFLTRYGAFIAAAGSIAAQYFYDPENKFLARLNQVLNNRLQFGLDAIQKYGFSLFGKEIRWVGQGSLQKDPTRLYNYVDCAFLKDGLSLGLLFLILVLAGFYFTGKRLELQKRYMESWAMLVALAYAVFNAHLCVLYFNVFILLLGENFSDDKEPSLKNMKREKGVCFSGLNFALTLYDLIPERLRGEKQRRVLRTALFLTLAFYVTVLQCLSTSYVVKTFDMHMWAVSGIFLLLAALCRGEEENCGGRRAAVFWPLLLFLILAGLSDLILNKRFRNVPFFLLVFGGLFCGSWGKMKYPERLLEEFQWACKAGFAAALLYCIAARPAVPGIRYSGFLPSPEGFGAVMTVMLAVFLSGVKKTWNKDASVLTRKISDRVFLEEMLNGIGAAAALYLIWKTQELSAVAAVASVLAVYAVFWLYCLFAEPGQKKTAGLLRIFIIAAAGFAAVLLLRTLLNRTVSVPVMRIVYAGDKNKQIKVPLQEALLSAKKWIRYFLAKWQDYKLYLRELNLTGHYYRVKYEGKAVWAASSFVMNLYRYGAAVGICYGFLLLASLWEAVQNTWRRKDFLPAGLAVSSAAAGMLTVTEMPFANLNWMLFYFVIAWLLADGRQRPMEERMRFLNIRIDNLTLDETLEKIQEMVETGRGGYVVTPNVDHIVKLEKDEKFREAYRGASLALTDGQPLIWISRLLGSPIKEKVSGSDLFPALCRLAAERQYRMYFLGAEKGVAQLAAENLKKSYPGLTVVGTYSPPYGFEKDPVQVGQIWEQIREAAPNLLIVGLGTPKQELFLWENRDRLDGMLAFGFGASLDFAAGKVRRAPRWMQKCGLEWFYRLCHEPRRLFKRYLVDDMKILSIVWKYRKAGTTDEDSD